MNSGIHMESSRSNITETVTSTVGLHAQELAVKEGAGTYLNTSLPSSYSNFERTTQDLGVATPAATKKWE